jgi:nucleotide-binding universal stress UspA family protein
MTQVQKILFPIDLASDNKTIIPWVLEMANKFDATVYLLYVTQPSTYFPTFYVNIDLESLLAEVQVGAKKQMATIVRNFFKNFPKLETQIELGRPADKILEIAQKDKIDLIIMGTHGRKGMEKAIFGSVALKVVQFARCPVLTIHP